MTELTKEEQRAYVFRVGKGGMEALATIEKLRPFIEMAESEIGQEFLGEDIRDHIFLINKCFDSLIKDGVAEQKDIIKLQLTFGRLKRHYDRLNNYETLVNKVKEAKILEPSKRPTQKSRRSFAKT